MKVKELIAELQKMDQDRLVILSIDQEGNGFGPVLDVATASYDEEWKEIGIEELTPELEKQGYCEDDLKPNGVPVVVLWP